MLSVSSIIANTLTVTARVLPLLRRMHDDQVQEDMELRRDDRDVKLVIEKILSLPEAEKSILINDFLKRFQHDYMVLSVAISKLLEKEEIFFNTLFNHRHVYREPIQFLLSYSPSRKLEIVAS